MYIVQSCGHSTELTNANALKGDMIIVASNLQASPCRDCKRAKARAAAEARVSTEAELLPLKGHNNKTALKIRQQFFTIVFWLFYDKDLEMVLGDNYKVDISKVAIYAARVREQTNADWWNRQHHAVDKMWNIVPSASVLPLIADLTAKLLLEEFESSLE